MNPYLKHFLKEFLINGIGFAALMALMDYLTEDFDLKKYIFQAVFFGIFYGLYELYIFKKKQIKKQNKI